MMKRMLRFKVVQHDAVLSELYKGMVNGQSWKVKAVMPAAKAYYSLLEKKIFIIQWEKPSTERTISENLKGKSWSELKQLPLN